MIDSVKYQAQASELSQKLWAIANDLRGNMDSTKFRNYILGTIFYSYLSERTEEYMQEILKEDGLTYEQAFSDADYRLIVEQWSIEHLGYIIKPENLFRELVRKIVRPEGDVDKFSVEDYERAVNELTGSTMGQASEAAFSTMSSMEARSFVAFSSAARFAAYAASSSATIFRCSGKGGRGMDKSINCSVLRL